MEFARGVTEQEKNRPYWQALSTEVQPRIAKMERPPRHAIVEVFAKKKGLTAEDRKDVKNFQHSANSVVSILKKHASALLQSTGWWSPTQKEMQAFLSDVGPTEIELEDIKDYLDCTKRLLLNKNFVEFMNGEALWQGL